MLYHPQSPYYRQFLTTTVKQGYKKKNDQPMNSMPVTKNTPKSFVE